MDSLKEFDDIELTGEVMPDSKKASYYSTMYFAGYQSNQKLRGTATIHVNLRDLLTKDDILKAIATEANRLGIVKVDADYYQKLLEAYFRSVNNEIPQGNLL